MMWILKRNAILSGSVLALWVGDSVSSFDPIFIFMTSDAATCSKGMADYKV